MQVTSEPDLTLMLQQLSSGRPEVLDELFPLVYDQLKSLASGNLRREYAASTLATTGLVHEAYFKLAGNSDRIQWRDRRHFFAVASRAMRQVLIGRALARKAEKRGAGAEHVPFDETYTSEERADELIALGDALTLLQDLYPRMAEIVDLRYFAGFSIAECADILNLSTATVNRDWRVARAWLYDFLNPAGS
ncbi:MAG: sigma-70 family RNA polymerase sigma factor [Bacteroidetes bacterium]|nr:sigma-70 family RNA polymerase sigma factor [Bacteroidota bacterium]